MTTTPSADAAPSSTAPPAQERAELSSQAVADVAALLPDWLEAQRTARQLTGVQAAIWHRGRIVCEVAVGTADASTGIDLLTTHRIRIASHSKMFCALTVLALAERGALRLDDTVGDHLDELSGAPISQVTVRDLLSHAAGLTRDHTDARWWQLSRPFPDRAELLGIAAGAVVAGAGEHLQYSNIGYGVLGLIIAQVSGQSFEEAVRELVLDPVGVAEIGPDLPAGAAGAEDPHGFAAGHTGLAQGPRRVVEQVPTRALAAATGFWATAGSIADFAGRVLCDGALLSDRWRREMRRRVWSVQDGSHYALGLQQGQLHGFTAMGHSGGFPTALTRTWAIPAERLVVSVLGTAIDAPTSDLAHRLLGLFALAGGRAAPRAESHESPGALGGAGAGRPRPPVLSEQPAVRLAGASYQADEIAHLVRGTYESVWGRLMIVSLGGRLFLIDGTGQDVSGAALELAVRRVGLDPVDSAPVVELMVWGDSGYGSWAEPLLARLEPDHQGVLRCTGVWQTGQFLTPAAEATLPDRICAPQD